MTNIPSDEEFERAARLMEQEFRGLDEIRSTLIQHFSKLCPLYDFHIMSQEDVDFRAYVFFEKEKDIAVCESRGINEKIVDFVYKKLEIAGRGKRSEITVAFEFDSHENVVANFEGDYFLRLR